MKLFVFVAFLVAALGVTSGQQYNMGMKLPSGMMAGQGGSMSARGMMAGGMVGGSMSASEEMESQEMSSGMMSANQGGLSRGGKMESGMMQGSTMMRPSGMESDRKMSSGMSGMRPMGMERSMPRESMSMRKEAGARKTMMMDSMSAENLEKVRMMNKEEMREHGILDSEMQVNPEGFMYKYKTDDGVDAFQTGTLSQGRSADESSMKVDGMYTWTAPNGHVYKVEYSADENGFHPRVTSRA